MAKATRQKRLFYVLWIFVAISFAVPQTLLGQKGTIPPNVQSEADKDEKLAKENEINSDFNQASYFYNKSATTYWSYGNLEKAQELFAKALGMSERIGNSNALYILNTNLGLIKSERGNSKEALAHFTKATEQATKLGRKQDVAASMLNQVNVYLDTEMLTDALGKLNTVHTMVKELNDPRMLRNTYSLFTKVYDKMGNREESAKYFELFAAITKKIQDEEIQRKEEEAQKIVSQAASRVQVVEAQKQATEQELVVRDMELVQKQKILEQTEQISREQQMKINLLNKEKELQQAKIYYQEQMRKVYISVIILVLLFAGYIYYNYQQKKKANIILQERNDRISKQNVEIHAQAQKLRELNQLKDKLFSIIAHDLRSPLGSLLTLLNLTQQGYFTEEGFKQVIDELSKNVGYTKELLENLLKWAQSQMEGLKVNPSYFNLYDVAQSKVELYTEQASSKGIIVTNSISSEIEVYADSAMIELVFRNLIANAIKYCNARSEVTIGAMVSEGKVTISVEDTGLGISPVNLERLFGREIFSTQGTSNEKGTGLGLILCKDFVTLNGGAIWAKSIEGKGSQFYFTIPYHG